MIPLPLGKSPKREAQEKSGPREAPKGGKAPEKAKPGKKDAKK